MQRYGNFRNFASENNKFRHKTVQTSLRYNKIGILGPESSGKSTLSSHLARHFGGTFIPEYAREYVSQLGRPYTYADVCHIAERNREEATYSASLFKAPVFFDTELIITKVWFQEVFGQCPGWLTSPIPKGCVMDYYLLLSPDIEWHADSVRENGNKERREGLFNLYLREIELTRSPYHIITGSGESRLQNAIGALLE